MKRMRNVKIVATLGPASSDEATIEALFEAGADVFRLNMSHGTQDDIAARHAIIRRIEEKTGRPIAILADLQGPKLRCGVFEGDAAQDLEEGAAFRFDLDKTPGDATRVCLPHPEIFEALEVGAHLLVNDGKLKLRVTKCGKDFADCVALNAGSISNRKGVNVPDVVCLWPRFRQKTAVIWNLLANWGWIGWRCPLCSVPLTLKRPVDWRRAVRRSCRKLKSPRP